MINPTRPTFPGLKFPVNLYDAREALTLYRMSDETARQLRRLSDVLTLAEIQACRRDAASLAASRDAGVAEARRLMAAARAVREGR
jgi:hypothetical protein